MTNVPPAVPFTFLETKYSKYWKVTVNAFRVGEKPKFKDNGETAAYFLDDKEAILDTFSPYIKIPRSYGSKIFNKFFHHVHYDNLDLD